VKTSRILRSGVLDKKSYNVRQSENNQSKNGTRWSICQEGKRPHGMIRIVWPRKTPKSPLLSL